VVVRASVALRINKVPIGRPGTLAGDEFSTMGIFLTYRPGLLALPESRKGHLVWYSTSLMVIWCVFFLHSTLPSQQPRCWVAPSACGCNISSSIPPYSLTSVMLVVVCPASSEHTSSPGGFELPILASTLFVGESHSWQRNRLSCALWLPNCCMDVLLMAIVDTSRSDRS